ncbi:MAG: acylpyruvase [Bacteroidetes bacterium]|jgi:2-keto-4-pentenoate hydratase/2-oxohepta-3-ene-1,7-dioic acid hydratase in catechol pathway|nr:acylpyruvase [Bacteroidota bacterium]
MAKVTFTDSQRFVNVGKCLCLGRNYPAHAKEMNAEVPDSPVVFIKPSTAVIGSGSRVIIPPLSRELHHEVEMVVLIGKEGKHIPRAEAFDYVAGYAVGLDMTLRDVQAEAKKKGLPWSIAKGFDTSAPVSAIMDKRFVPDPHSLKLSLKVNGVLRQCSSTAHMIFRVDFIISYLSSIFTLEAGDLIFTGTPEGVGEVFAGDEMEASLENVGVLRVGVESSSSTVQHE